MKYHITLKSGVVFEATGLDATKNVIGLWIYLLKKVSPSVIDFEQCTILTSEIAMIKVIRQ